MNNEQLLKQIGLTDLEARTYLVLLQLRVSTAGKLAEKLNVQRSTVYYLLNSLIQRGFVAFSLRGKRRLFQANNPHILEQQAKETYEKIKDMIPQLISQQPKEEKDEVMLFTGYKGLQSAYEQMLAESKSSDEFLVLGARGGEDISRETYRAFYKNFSRKRIKKKIQMRVIMNTELKLKIGKYYEKLPMTKIKYLPHHTLAPIVIFSSGIAIVQWKEDPSLFLLKGRIVQESFKQFFDALWNVTKD